MKEGWEVKKFSDVFDLQMGKTPSRDNVEYWSGDNCWVAISDIKEKYISETKECITNKAVTDTKIKEVKADTVIMSFKLTVGRTAIAKKTLYTNEAIMAFNLKSNYEVLPEYTYYYLKAYKWEGGNKAVMGITLNKASISANIFAFPPLPEQSRIVEELDLLSNIIEKKRQQLSELDNLAQSIFYDMFGDPVMNEKGWEVKKLGETGIFARGVSKHRPRNAAELLGGTMPLIQTGDIAKSGMYLTKYEATYSDLGVQQSKVWPSGTLCITIAATIGKCSILSFDACFPDSVVGYLINKDLISNEYVYFLFGCLQSMLEANAPSVAQKNINLQVLNSLEVPLPPLNLQQLFAQKIEAIEKQKALIKQSIAETEELFNSRMDYYFN